MFKRNRTAFTHHRRRVHVTNDEALEGKFKVDQKITINPPPHLCTSPVKIITPNGGATLLRMPPKLFNIETEITINFPGVRGTVDEQHVMPIVTLAEFVAEHAGGDCSDCKLPETVSGMCHAESLKIAIYYREKNVIKISKGTMMHALTVAEECVALLAAAGIEVIQDNTKYVFQAAMPSDATDMPKISLLELSQCERNGDYTRSVLRNMLKDAFTDGFILNCLVSYLSFTVSPNTSCVFDAAIRTFARPWMPVGEQSPDHIVLLWLFIGNRYGGIETILKMARNMMKLPEPDRTKHVYVQCAMALDMPVEALFRDWMTDALSQTFFRSNPTVQALATKWYQSAAKMGIFAIDPTTLEWAVQSSTDPRRNITNFGFNVVDITAIHDFRLPEESKLFGGKWVTVFKAKYENGEIEVAWNIEDIRRQGIRSLQCAAGLYPLI